MRSLIGKIKRTINQLLERYSPGYILLRRIETKLDRNTMLSARILIGEIQKKPTVTDFKEVEFSIFSQWGEDGIIQYLLSKVPIENDSFVEFGVETYRESNTRFLLVNNNWKGLVIDGNPHHVETIKADDISMRYDLTARCAFITRENINQLISSAGLNGDIGLLSIDIDGNDYWIWEAIEVVSPRIVVCEYNAVFGPSLVVTIPYNAEFNRTEAHYSNLYFGASLSALCRLATKKGYTFVGCSNAGINAFFVRRDVGGGVNTLDLETGFRGSKVRESRDKNGELTFVTADDRLRLIQDMQVVDLNTGTTKTLLQCREARQS